MDEREGTTKQPRKRLRVLLLCLIVFVGSVLGMFQVGVVYTDTTWERWCPDYAKVDITPVLNKQILTEADYELLYHQTGLSKSAIDDMRVKTGGIRRIQEIQTNFFTDFEMKSYWFAPFTYMDEIKGLAKLCDLKDGDIIVSSTTRVSWWRYGHSALVSNGERKELVECIGPGEKSKNNSADTFAYLGNFLVLRPKINERIKAQVASYAQEHLIGLTYRFSIGLFSPKYVEDIRISQCAHLVWYAYKKFGFDLDSNGGWLVKPQDIALSEHVEVVQTFGFDPDTLWV